MTTLVTVWTSATTSLLVPFTTQSNADAAQAAMDSGPNSFAPLGGVFMQYFEPAPTVSGLIGRLRAPFLGGIVQTGTQTINYGVVPDNYLAVVNAGSGELVAIGGAQSSLWSAQNATTLFINRNTQGEAFLGGGHSVISNFAADDAINIAMDSDAGSVLGASTLILDDHVGGGSTVTANAGDLVLVEAGGQDKVIGNPGTVVVFTIPSQYYFLSTTANAPTIAAAGAGSTLWVGPQGQGAFITPGAGDVYVFEANGFGSEDSVTLFGGTQVIGGQTLTAPAMTGRVTVTGVDGWLQAGSAGMSIIQTGTVSGAATVFAGGADDTIILEALDNVANLGDAPGVLAVVDQTVQSVLAGDTFYFGNGSGAAYGAQDGHNSFVFTGSGTYTVAGFHDPSFLGFLQGSVYRDAVTTPGGHVTIADFLPAQNGFVFDQFDLGTASVTTLTSTPLGSGNFDTTVQLSDGLTITFANTFGTIHQSGTVLL